MSVQVVDGAEQLLGMAICNHCQKRYRVYRKHEAMVGKTVRCPACRQSFQIALEAPSPIENAAIQNAANATAKSPEKKARRSKNQIRQEFTDRIRGSLKSFHKRLSEIVEQAGSEEQVRVWCIDFLKSVLEYEDCHIDTEVMALGQRIDIALKHEESIFMIIECKNPRAKLGNAVRDQAVMYAVNKSSDWAVATNGHVWKLWRVVPQKGKDPKVVQVFDLGLLDEDGISERDIANFYLLTKRALFNGETTVEFHRREASSDQRLLAAIENEKIVAAVRKVLVDDYQAETGERVSFEEGFLEQRIEEMFLPEEL